MFEKGLFDRKDLIHPSCRYLHYAGKKTIVKVVKRIEEKITSDLKWTNYGHLYDSWNINNSTEVHNKSVGIMRTAEDVM